uniref:Rad21/Rec8-like protein N-terminal domain-containing protein n=1 Tax=Musca domestica TaxID=7370 RepID=A0A1I8NJS2_MUSDO
MVVIIQDTANRNVIIVSSHIYRNPIFDLIPKPLPGEDQTSYIKKFVNQIAALFAKANILQKYVLFKYVMEIYGQVLENEQAKWRPKIKPLPPPAQRKERPRIQAAINVSGDGEDGENARANVQSIEEVMPMPVGQGEVGGVASESVEEIRLDLSAVNNENVYLLPPDEGTTKEKDDMMTFNFVGKYLDNIDDHLGVRDFENFNVEMNNSSMTSYPTMSQHLSELNERNNQPSVMGQVPTTEQRRDSVYHTPKTRYHLRPRSSALLASLGPGDTTPPGQRRSAALRSSNSSETTPTQRPIHHQRRRRFLTEDEYSLCLPIRKRKIIAEARLPLPRNNVCHTVVSYYSMDFSLIREEFSHALHGRSFFARAENNRTTEPSLVIISPEEIRNPPPPPHEQPPAAIDQLQNSTLDQVRHIDFSHMMPGNLQGQHLLVPPPPQPHQETAVHQSNISAMDDVRQAPSNLGGDLSLPLRMTSQKQLAPENLPSSFAATAGEANNSLQIAAEDFGIPPPPQPRGDQVGDIEIPPPPPAIQEADELLQPPFPALDGTNTSAQPDDVLMPPPPPPPETSANASGLESSNLMNITEYNPLRPLPTPDSGAPGLNVSHYPRLHGEDEAAEPTPQGQLSASDSVLASAGLDKTLRNPLVEVARPTPDSGVPNISAGNLSKFKTPMLQGSADVPEGGATLSSADEDQFHSNLQRQREISMASTPIRRPSQDLSVSARPSLAKTIDIHSSNEESGSNNTTTTQLANMGPSSQVQQQNLQLGISQLPRITEEFAIRPSTFEQQIPIAATIPEMSQSTNQSSNAAGGDAGWYRDWLAILRDRQQNPNYTNTTLPQRKRRRRHPRIQRPRRLNVDEEEEEGPISNIPQNIDAPEIAGSGGNSLSKAAAVQAFFSAFIPETTASPPPQPPPAIVINGGRTNGGFTDEIPPASSPPSPLAASQESAYHRFVRENTNDLAMIWEHIRSCYALLGQRIPPTEEEDGEEEGGIDEEDEEDFEITTRRPQDEETFRKFDLQTLLSAPRKRLNVKLNIIQNLVRYNSFDFTKLPCIEDRISAAMGFAFVLELKAAGFVFLSSDGCTVALA